MGKDNEAENMPDPTCDQSRAVTETESSLTAALATDAAVKAAASTHPSFMVAKRSRAKVNITGEK